MSAQLLPNVLQQYFNSNGMPLAGGMLFSYQAGTTTPLATYTDQTQVTPNANPVILNSSGVASIWLGPSAYKFVLQDSLGNIQWSVDNVSIINPNSIDKTKMNANVAGVALLQNGTGSFDVQVDNATIQITGTGNGVLSVRQITANSFTSASKLEVVTKMVRDLTCPGIIQQIPQYEWTAPTLLANPVTLPTGGASAARWSPNGEFLAVGFSTTPFVSIYQLSGTTLTKLADPASLPAGAVFDLSWSPCGDFLAMVCGTTPYIAIYQRSGNSFTKLTTPVSIPTSAPINGSIAFSPNSDFLALGYLSFSAPGFIMYERAGTTFTDITTISTITGIGNPICWSQDSSLFAGYDTATGEIDVFKRINNVFAGITPPTVTPYLTHVLAYSFSPDGNFMAVGVSISPYLLIFQISSGAFTQLPNPATLPLNSVNSLGWSANSEYLACGISVTPFTATYQVSGATFTKVADPAVAIAASAHSVDFSQTKQFLAISSNTTPFVQVYETASTLPSNALLWTRGTPNV